LARVAGSSIGLENFAGVLQGLEESDDILDLVILVEAVLAPGRHHRLRIVDARIEDIVEEPLVGAAGGADLRQVGADVARHFRRLRAHDVAGEAAATAAAVEGELLGRRPRRPSRP